MKKRKLLAIMMASLALAGVGVETATSLNNTESVVEAKSRKRHHKCYKRRVTHKRKNKKRKTNKRREKVQNKEYYSKGHFFSNGLEMSRPKRIDYFDASHDVYTTVLTFKLTNKTKHEIDVGGFLFKHLAFYSTNNGEKVKVVPDTYMELSFIPWTKKELREQKNTLNDIKPRKSKVALIGTAWKAYGWDMHNQWEINYLGNKGQVIKKENLPINVQSR